MQASAVTRNTQLCPYGITPTTPAISFEQHSLYRIVRLHHQQRLSQYLSPTSDRIALKGRIGTRGENHPSRQYLQEHGRYHSYHARGHGDGSAGASTRSKPVP